MYCSILHRINMQNPKDPASLTEISTNQKTNFTAFGDSKGLLQIINLSQIENQLQSNEKNDPEKKTSFQALSFHKSEIKLISWNSSHNKLVTVDISGSLVVWKKTDELFESEMINNRGTSMIKDVKWSKSGNNICFLYEDGHLYSGTVEGKNTWFNDLEEEISFVEWSPNDDKILISKKSGKIFVLSSSGRQIGEIMLSEQIQNLEIAGIDWWGNNEEKIKKHLMIAFKNGIVVLIDDEIDDQPVVINTGLNKIIKTQWEVNGLCIGILGEINENENNVKNVILFYNINGELVKKFNCPNKIISFSWGFSFSICLTSEKYLYLGFVKYKYKWTFFCNTIVFAYLIGDNKYNIMYLDINNNTKQCKLVYNLIDIISADYYCGIITQNNENEFSLIITNNFCNVLTTKNFNINPKFYSMNNEFIIISDEDYIYIFQYKGYIKKNNKDIRNLINNELSSSRSNINIGISKLDPKTMHEFCFFNEEQLNPNDEYDYINFVHEKKSKNKIINIFLTNNFLYTGKDNGEVNRFDLTLLNFDRKYQISENLLNFGISPYDKYLWNIDIEDQLTLYDIQKEKIEKLEFTQKDVWEIKWCSKTFNDNEEEAYIDLLKFAIIQKNKLFFISDLVIENETPIICQNYLSNYIDNEVTTVKIEKLNIDRNKDFFQVEDYIQKFENKLLKEFKQILDSTDANNLKAAYDYATKHPCKTFFNSITKKAMENLDFDTAQKTMLQTGNFDGLDFLNKVKNIEDNDLKMAEISQYNNNFEEASKQYTKMNRTDLDLAMNMKLGKWDKVTDLMSKTTATKDDNLKIAYNNYAEELMEKKDYDKAEENFEKSGNIHGLTRVYFAKEDYDKAVNMLEVIPEEDEFLEEMGEKFNSIGMCDEAVKAYIKCGNILKALQTYVENNKWKEAIELSAENDFINMENLTNKFGSEFLKSGRKFDLVELYRKANMRNNVFKYLNEIAIDMRKIHLSPLLIKKIYVLAALELEVYKSQICDSQINSEDVHKENKKEKNGVSNKKKLSDYFSIVREIDKILLNQWKGAEAFHYYMLCQVQLYKKKYKEACKTVMRLTLYEKELGSEEVYRLIALCSFLNNCFKICSKALAILENLECFDIHTKNKYKKLAESIFLKYGPKNVGEKFYKCPNSECGQSVSEYDIYCKNCGCNFSGCVLSGSSILDHHYFKCKQCHHKTKKSEVKKTPINNCPLCHVSLREKPKKE